MLFPLLAASAVGGALPPTLVPTEIVTVYTEDGWALPLRHHASDTGGPAVLLAHGMGANHYNWDYRPEVSLADALVAEGFDVWVLSLRGDPGTAAPSRRSRRTVTFDDYAQYDVSAAVHGVLHETGQEQLHFVGHSLGGMLLYTWLAQEPETVASGVAIASPSQFVAQRLPWTLGPVRWTLAGRGVVRVRAFASVTAVLGRHNPQYARLANRENLDWDVAMGLSHHALSDIPKPLARQALQWVASGELQTTTGEPWIVPVDVPLLVLGGPLDKVVAEADVAATCDIFPECTYRSLSPAGGFSAAYGHVDPVVGRTARVDVYPVIAAFLAQ